MVLEQAGTNSYQIGQPGNVNFQGDTGAMLRVESEQVVPSSRFQIEICGDRGPLAQIYRRVLAWFLSVLPCFAPTRRTRLSSPRASSQSLFPHTTTSLLSTSTSSSAMTSTIAPFSRSTSRSLSRCAPTVSGALFPAINSSELLLVLMLTAQPETTPQHLKVVFSRLSPVHALSQASPFYHSAPASMQIYSDCLGSSPSISPPSTLSRAGSLPSQVYIITEAAVRSSYYHKTTVYRFYSYSPPQPSRCPSPT